MSVTFKSEQTALTVSRRCCEIGQQYTSGLRAGDIRGRTKHLDRQSYGSECFSRSWLLRIDPAATSQTRPGLRVSHREPRTARPGCAEQSLLAESLPTAAGAAGGGTNVQWHQLRATESECFL